MRITYTHEINDFYDLRDLCWSGAQQVLDIVEEHDLEEEFFEYVATYFDPTSDYTSTDINDFVWFECDDWLEEHTKGEN